MQITETSSEGLKRELKVVIGASDLSDRYAARLNELKDQISLKGFRPGKVPVAHIKRVYGRSVMAEVLQSAVNETSQKALEDRKERPALAPQIRLTEDEAEIEQILGGKADLAFGMTYEVIPAIDLGDLGAIEIERPVAEVTEEAIGRSIDNLAEGSTKFEPREGRAAVKGDQVTIDFAASVASRIRESYWHPSQQLEPLDNGGVRLRVSLPSLLEITPWVRGWGPEAVVIEPPELREEIASSMAAAAANYQRQ